MLNDEERHDFELLKEKFIEICAYNDLLRAEIKNLHKMIDAREEEIKALNKGIKRLSEQLKEQKC